MGKLSDLAPRREKRAAENDGNETMGMDRTRPFHAGTQNDCGLHTIASLTGKSEAEVVRSLGLSTQDIQHISAHGIQPEQFTAMLSHLNSGSVAHQHGTPSQLVNDFLPGVPDGHQFALGMQRQDGIGHLVSARRVGESLQIHDRQIGSVVTVQNQEQLNSYMQQQGASHLHTWYDRPIVSSQNTVAQGRQQQYPQQQYPQQNYPQQNYPQQQYPQQQYPQQNYPQQNYPQQNYPQQNYPQQNYPRGYPHGGRRP